MFRRLLLYCFIFLYFHSIININVSATNYIDKCTFRWLHPPKTSSTFCLSLQHVCNETRFVEHAQVSTHTILQFGCVVMKPEGSHDGNRHHDPINTHDMEKGLIKNFVTVLREPTSRIISSFCDNMHLEGLNTSIRKDLMNQMDFNYHFGSNNKIRNDGWPGRWGKIEKKCVSNFYIYARFPPCYGCYTKMLNGYDCMSNITITQNMVENAIILLKQFLFVGLTEDYELSVKIFLNKAFQSDVFDPTTRLGYKENHSNSNDNDNTISSSLQQKLTRIENVNIMPHEIEFSHFRPGSHLCSPILKKLANEKKLNYTDPYDSIIYKEAIKLFLKEREIYESQLP